MMQFILLISLIGICSRSLLGNHILANLLDVSIDVGKSHPFVLLEHLNINTGGIWNKDFEKFYFDALGFVSDPRSELALHRTRGAGGITNGLLWANIGLQQIHFPFDDAQRVRGYIGLEYQDINVVISRLQRANVAHSVLITQNPSERFVETSCPVGNRFRIHEQNIAHQPGLEFAQPNNEGDATTDTETNDYSPTWLGPQPHMAPSAQFELPGGRSVGLGIAYINFDCPANTARKICRFYEYFFGSRSYVVDDGSSHTPSCIIPIGYRQHLRFTELAPVTDASCSSDDDTVAANNIAIGVVKSCTANALPEYDGHHIAVYVNDFVGTYTRAAQFNLNWDNPRFPQFTYHNVSEALRHNEFRVRDIIDLDTNETIYQLEHEIRSLVHPAFCCKSLVVHPAGPAIEQ